MLDHFLRVGLHQGDETDKTKVLEVLVGFLDESFELLRAKLRRAKKARNGIKVGQVSLVEVDVAGRCHFRRSLTHLDNRWNILGN